jgi:hypothetical protein
MNKRPRSRSISSSAAVLVLLAGCARSGPSESVGSDRAAFSADTTVTFSVTQPVGVAAPKVFLSAGTGGLHLDDGVTLIDSSGSATVVSGAAGLSAGVSTVVGHVAPATVVNVVSTGTVTLANQAEVTGTVQSRVAPVEQAGAKIDGTLTVDPTLFVTDNNWQVTFPGTTLGDVDLEPGTARTLKPGAYGNVAVKSRSTLTLGAGTYTFASLDVEPQATVASNTSAAPLVLYVQSSLVLNGPISATGGASSLLLAYAGSAAVTVNVPFSGTLVAPSSALVLGGNPPTKHTGSFFAQSLEVRPRLPVVHVAFGSWATAIPLQGSSKVTPVVISVPAPVPPPPLGGPADVPAFLAWANGSQPGQVDDGRAVILGAVGNEAIAAAIVAAINADPDLGDNLVAMSVLGELRTNTGFNFFSALATAPLPATDAGVTAETSPGDPNAGFMKRQARAVDGLTLMMTPAADNLVLNVISTAQSNLVRARAVYDYLFVHGADGRATVAALLPPDQQILLDRFNTQRGPYNARLAAYLAKHPEVLPPPPVQNDP